MSILFLETSIQIFDQSCFLNSDACSQAQIVQQFRRDGQEIYPPIGFNEFFPESRPSGLDPLKIDGGEYYPLSGISNVQTGPCSETPFWKPANYITFESDRFGLRNPDDVWNKDNQIIILGDSFLQGACVEEPEMISSRIRNEFPSTLNLGIGGNGPLVELASLKEFAPASEMKLVVMFFYGGNDFNDLRVNKESKILKKYLEQPDYSQGLKSNWNKINTVLKNRVDKRLNESETSSNYFIRLKEIHLEDIIKLRRLRRNMGLRGLTEDKNIQKLTLKAFKDVLHETNRYAQSNNAKTLLVYLPSLGELKYNYNRRNRKFMEVVNELSIDSIDLYDHFRNLEDPTLIYFRKGFGYGHFNPRGYKLVSEKVLRLLRKSIMHIFNSQFLKTDFVVKIICI